MSLNDVKARNAKPREKPYKLSDGNGLYLFVHQAGGKYWRMKYRFAGKEKKLALGVYPDVGLADARNRCADARKALTAGNDPSEVKKEAKRHFLIKQANSFESVAREWIEAKKNRWTPRYADFMAKRLESDIFPKLGSRPIADIAAPELLAVLRVIEKRGALELAQRAKQTCGQIFMYGIATGRVERNPAADLQGALKTHAKQNFTHLKEAELPEFLQKLNGYQGMKQNQLAVKLLMLTFVRTNELRGALWTDIDFDKAEWRIPAERMKMRRPHIVPLSRQAVAILKELKLMNGAWNYVFPNPYRPVKSMSENGVLNVIYRMGYRGRTTGHGFRHTASTILNEHGFNADHIERQLAHVEANKVRGAYNHAEYLPERRKMMQWWADYLDAKASTSTSKAAAMPRRDRLPVIEEQQFIDDIVAALDGEQLAHTSKRIKEGFAKRVLKRVILAQQTYADSLEAINYREKVSKLAKSAHDALLKYKNIPYIAPTSILRAMLSANIQAAEVTTEIETIIAHLKVVSRFKGGRNEKVANLLAASLVRMYQYELKEKPKHHHSFTPRSYDHEMWANNAEEATPFDLVCHAIFKHTKIDFSEALLRKVTTMNKRGETSKKGTSKGRKST